MVAKSFQSMEQICDPYEVSGKMYVKVKNPKTGNTRQVRWYTEKEYAKYYPEVKIIKPDHSNDPYWKPRKVVLGFEKGYVTIFKGDTFANLDWFRSSCARYNKICGWFIPSELEIPEDMPKDLVPIKLDWDLIAVDENTLKPDAVVREVVDGLLYESDGSEYVGEIGERIEKDFTIVRVLPQEGNYGSSTLHMMKDEDGNIYLWNTAARTLSEGETYRMKGTVKDHKIYRNSKETILTRCKEI
jgi:hypothetical protein